MKQDEDKKKGCDKSQKSKKFLGFLPEEIFQKVSRENDYLRQHGKGCVGGYIHHPRKV